jgi:mono/diheme cytochrome c family protein
MKRARATVFSLVIFVILSMLAWAAKDYTGWMKHVPETDRKRVNPYAGQSEAIAAGAKLFSDHCAKCHGADALGSSKKPNLRAPEVQQAADGEIFWLLRNGDLLHGMPSWSAIPEPSRWQIIAYVKSLGVSSSGASSSDIKLKQESPK